VETLLVPAGRETIAVDLLRRPGRELLLILPGFWRTRTGDRLRALAERLARVSSVALVDLRGHGDSTGTYTFGTDEPGDVRAVIEHLAARGYTRIGVLGFSMGGPIAMDAVRNPPQGVTVLGAALVSAPTEVRYARPMILSPRAFGQLNARSAVRPPRFRLRALLERRVRASDARPRGESFPVRIFHCKRDWLIPDTEATRWASDLGPRATVTIFDDARRLHADALLRCELGLPERLLEWWTALGDPGHRVGDGNGADDRSLPGVRFRPGR
jgi:pimeloyl-ACP methyl ester carboxylesterase